MAWKDPLTERTEIFVDALGAYLTDQGDIAINRIARIQEVCRNFAEFLSRDIQMATPQDYAAYIQKHAATPQDKADYQQMMDAIRNFAEQNKLTDSAQNNKGQPARKSAKTCHFDNSPEMLQNLINLSKGETSENTRNSATKSQNVSATESQNVSATESPDVSATESPLDDLSDAIPELDSIANGFNQFDFSIDDNLANELVTPPKNENDEHPKSHSGLASIADEIAIGPLDSKKDIPQNNELLRGVDNIDYDFSSNNIKKMREVDKKSVYNSANFGSIAPNGFRSWLYDGKYMIDQPMPSPQNLKIFAPNKIVPILIATTPVLIMIALTAITAVFNAILGAVCLVLTLICIVFSLSDIIPASQQTIQATLSAFIQARSGCCINRASALIAFEDENPNFSLADLWKEQGFKLPIALLSRLKSTPIPEYTIISGSDSQNAVLLLTVTEDAYYLIPMARTQDRWFITDPTLGKHIIRNADNQQ